MNNSIACAFAFAAGAAAGAAIAWKLLKDKYEQISREEAEAFREAIAQRRADTEGTEDAKEEPEPESEPESKVSYRTVKPGLQEYATLLQKQGYSSDKEGGRDVVNRPYIITPDEFGDIYEYETISLTYYADGVLTDEFDEIITNIDDVVGLDSLNHFGEYEDDSVFVRNDDALTDYEILLDERKYSETHGSQVDE